MFKELQFDRSHSSDEEILTDNDAEFDIVQVNDGARVYHDDAAFDFDMPSAADTMNEERSKCGESDGSGSDHSSVDCDKGNPFEG